MMEERDFAKYAFLIVAVVAVVGLLSTGGLDVTGFLAKASRNAPRVVTCDQAQAMEAQYCVNPNTGKCKNARTLVSRVCQAAREDAALQRLGRAKEPAADVPPQPEGAKCVRGLRCAEGLECLEEKCQRVTCEDSDAANDPAVQGTVTLTASISGVMHQRSDTCVGAQLKQVTCPEAKYQRAEACPEGSACENGACVLLPPEPFCRTNSRARTIETLEGSFNINECVNDIATTRQCTNRGPPAYRDSPPMVVSAQQCSAGCNQEGTYCCTQVRQVSQTCQGNILTNTTVSECTQREYANQIDCAPFFDGQGQCVENYGCAPCGGKVCNQNVDGSGWKTTIRAGENCPRWAPNIVREFPAC